jgi:AcrR family transcriptional regulator
MARPSTTAVRRREIVDATVRVMARRGWNDTSIDEITREARVSRGLVSYHFKDKNELLSGVLARCREMFLEDVQKAYDAGEPAERRMLCATRASLLLVRTNPLPYEVFLHFSTNSRADPQLAEEVRTLYRTYREQCANTIRECQERGVYRLNIDPDAAAAKHMATLIGISLQWLIDPGCFDLDAAGELALEMLIGSLRIDGRLREELDG